MKIMHNKKSTEKRYKLSNRICLFVGIVSTVILALICIISGSITRTIVSDMTRKQVSSISQTNASLVNSYLQNMNVFSNGLAKEVNRYKELGKEQGEKFVIDSLKGILNDKDIFGAYFAFEPNKYFEDTPNGLSYYAYKDNGKISIDILNDYSTYKSGDYYTGAKSNMNAHITEPYEYKLSNGNSVWIVTLSNPIVDSNGNFIGVANCDILTDTLSNLPYTKGEYTSAYSTLITHNGTYIANTMNSSLVGTALTKNNTTDADILEAATTASEKITNGKNPENGNKNIIFCNPIKVDGTDIVWTTTFSVDENEAFRAVDMMVLSIVAVCTVGVVALVFLSYVTITKKLKPMDYVMKMAYRMRDAELDTDLDIDYKFDNNELGALGDIFINMSIGMTAILKDISRLLTEMSHGNFNIKSDCPERYIGVYVNIRAALNGIISNLSSTLKRIDIASNEVNSSSSQVSSAAQTLSQGATEQAASIEELSATINDLAQKIKNTAISAQVTTETSGKATKSVLECNDQMNSLLEAMNEISHKSNEIGKIIKTIDDIAFQTNILALNAAVEAARAGAAGKGFAVVADEVRSLAAKSAEAAKNTTTLINGSIDAVENGTSMAQQTAKTLSDIVGGVQESTKFLQKISEDSEEQSFAIAEINQGVEQISAVVQNNSATAQQTAAASEELSSQAETLRSLVQQFEYDDSREYCNQ